jgi:hypothetical protein
VKQQKSKLENIEQGKRRRSPVGVLLLRCARCTIWPDARAINSREEEGNFMFRAHSSNIVDVLSSSSCSCFHRRRERRANTKPERTFFGVSESAERRNRKICKMEKEEEIRRKKKKKKI